MLNDGRALDIEWGGGTAQMKFKNKRPTRLGALERHQAPGNFSAFCSPSILITLFKRQLFRLLHLLEDGNV